jgi:Protein of unknown function (DUF742)
MTKPAGDGEAEEDGSPGIRPFVMTSGRVAAPDPDLRLETRVTARTSGNGRLSFEHAAIVALCAQPMSIAEISARLHLHLGVTRVLVSDLRAGGYLEVESMDVDEATDLDTIQRVFDGLRALS